MIIATLAIMTIWCLGKALNHCNTTNGCSAKHPAATMSPVTGNTSQKDGMVAVTKVTSTNSVLKANLSATLSPTSSVKSNGITINQLNMIGNNVSGSNLTISPTIENKIYLLPATSVEARLQIITAEDLQPKNKPAPKQESTPKPLTPAQSKKQPKVAQQQPAAAQVNQNQTCQSGEFIEHHGLVGGLLVLLFGEPSPTIYSGPTFFQSAPAWNDTYYYAPSASYYRVNYYRANNCNYANTRFFACQQQCPQQPRSLCYRR